MPLLPPVSSSPHRVLIAGCSYGGIATVLDLLNLIDGKSKANSFPQSLLNNSLHRGLSISIIDERDGFFHTVGVPLAHVARPYIEPLWKPFHQIKQLQRPEVQIHRGTITRIDCEAKEASFVDLEDGNKPCQMPYDYLVLATGLKRDFPEVPRALTKSKYLQDAEEIVSSIEKATNDSVTIIGGGAVGVEIAAEIKNNHPHLKTTLVHSRNEILSNDPLPAEFKSRALSVLKEEGVEVILNQRAIVAKTGNSKSRVVLADGREFETGKAIRAIARPTPITGALPSECLDKDGYVKVFKNLTLKSNLPNASHHFAIGDVAALPGIRRAGGAMYMGHIAAAHIFAHALTAEDSTLELDPLPEYPEVGPMIGLAVGSQIVTCGPGQEIKWGKELMNSFFGADLGWTLTLSHLGITDTEG